MVGRKQVRTRGKLKLSRYFQDFIKGNSVAVDIEKSTNVGFPKRLQGRTGKIESKKGKVYIVKIRDQTKEKEFLIPPIHLKKIQTKEKNDKK